MDHFLERERVEVLFNSRENFGFVNLSTKTRCEIQCSSFRHLLLNFPKTELRRSTQQKPISWKIQASIWMRNFSWFFSKNKKSENMFWVYNVGWLESEFLHQKKNPREPEIKSRLFGGGWRDMWERDSLKKSKLAIYRVTTVSNKNLVAWQGERGGQTLKQRQISEFSL